MNLVIAILLFFLAAMYVIGIGTELAKPPSPQTGVKVVVNIVGAAVLIWAGVLLT